MPGHRFPGALLHFWLLNGSPWSWQTWKDVTGLSHGLFPDDDSKLPPGLDRAKVVSIKAFFSEYANLSKEDDKIKFFQRRGNAPNAGRDAWLNFTSMLWKRAKIHDKIVKCFRVARVHPADLCSTNAINSSDVKADEYIPLAIDTIGLELFGQDILDPSSFLVAQPYRSLVRQVAMQSWESLRYHLVKASTKLPDLKTKAEEAIQAANLGFTKFKFETAIKATGRYHAATLLNGTIKDQNDAEQMRVEIQDCFVRLGGTGDLVPNNSEMKAQGKLCKVTIDVLSKLATASDVEDLLRLYQEHFASTSLDAVELVMPDLELQLCMDGDDLGVEVEVQMDANALGVSLGFGANRNLPLLFNRYRHLHGLDPWDQPGPFDKKLDTFDRKQLSRNHLHWHQLAGLHAVIRKLFTNTASPENPLGVLLADEVGLGKTALAIATIAYLSNLVWHVQEGETMPPIIRTNSYLGANTTVPSLPHLIVVPGTLVSQWVKELKTLFKPRKVDILIYNSKKEARMQFWQEGGVYASSNHLPHQRIILASESALLGDFQMFFQGKPPPGSLPWSIPPPLLPSQSLENSLFGQHYLTLTVDEAHRYKNIGSKHFAILQVRKNTLISLACTATPLQTNPKDVANIGRIVGIKHFSTAAYLDEERNDTNALRKARAQDDNGATEAREKLSIVRRIQKQYEGHLIRRTASSTNSEGDPLIDLPPLITTECYLKLDEREMTIINALAEKAKENVASSNGGKPWLTQNFYNEYRGSFFANPDEPLPTFTNMEEWLKVRSTKLDCFARICAHYLKRDDVTPISFTNGELVIPATPEDPGKLYSRSRRVCAYIEYVSFRPLIEQVLRLYGVEFLWIDGAVPFPKRTEVIQKFHSEGNPRLLIFSSVGTAGLNLAIADVIIQLDVCWSAQDMRQITGRVYRQPQKKVVQCIHLIAADTSDCVMFAMAKGKKDMLEAFVNKPSQAELLQLISGECIGGEEELEDEGSTVKPKRSTRSKPKKAKIATSGTAEKPTLGPDQGAKGKAKADGAKQAKGEEVGKNIGPKTDASEQGAAAVGKRRKDQKKSVEKMPTSSKTKVITLNDKSKVLMGENQVAPIMRTELAEAYTISDDEAMSTVADVPVMTDEDKSMDDIWDDEKIHHLEDALSPVKLKSMRKYSNSSSEGYTSSPEARSISHSQPGFTEVKTKSTIQPGMPAAQTSNKVLPSYVDLEEYTPLPRETPRMINFRQNRQPQNEVADAVTPGPTQATRPKPRPVVMGSQQHSRRSVFLSERVINMAAPAHLPRSEVLLDGNLIAGPVVDNEHQAPEPSQQHLRRGGPVTGPATTRPSARVTVSASQPPPLEERNPTQQNLRRRGAVAGPATTRPSTFVAAPASQPPRQDFRRYGYSASGRGVKSRVRSPSLETITPVTSPHMMASPAEILSPRTMSTISEWSSPDKVALQDRNNRSPPHTQIQAPNDEKSPPSSFSPLTGTSQYGTSSQHMNNRSSTQMQAGPSHYVQAPDNEKSPPSSFSPLTGTSQYRTSSQHMNNRSSTQMQAGPSHYVQAPDNEKSPPSSFSPLTGTSQYRTSSQHMNNRSSTQMQAGPSRYNGSDAFWSHGVDSSRYRTSSQNMNNRSPPQMQAGPSRYNDSDAFWSHGVDDRLSTPFEQQSHVSQDTPYDREPSRLRKRSSMDLPEDVMTKKPKFGKKKPSNVVKPF